MKALIDALTLLLSGKSKEFQLFTDASSCGLDAMLVQDGKAIAYAFKNIECNRTKLCYHGGVSRRSFYLGEI